MEATAPCAGRYRRRGLPVERRTGFIRGTRCFHDACGRLVQSRQSADQPCEHMPTGLMTDCPIEAARRQRLLFMYRQDSTWTPVRLINLGGFLACALLLGGAYYLQFLEHLEPCPLCIFQRMAMFPLGLIFLIAAIHHPKGWGSRVYGVLIGMLPLWASLLFPSPLDSEPAGGSGSGLRAGPGLSSEQLSVSAGHQSRSPGLGRMRRGSKVLGLSIPVWSLVAFVVLGAVGVVANFKATPGPVAFLPDPSPAGDGRVTMAKPKRRPSRKSRKSSKPRKAESPWRRRFAWAAVALVVLASPTWLIWIMWSGASSRPSAGLSRPRVCPSVGIVLRRILGRRPAALRIDGIEVPIHRPGGAARHLRVQWGQRLCDHPWLRFPGWARARPGPEGRFRRFQGELGNGSHHRPQSRCRAVGSGPDRQSVSVPA